MGCSWCQEHNCGATCREMRSDSRPVTKRKRRAVKLNIYRVYGNDTDSYAFGGPLFPPVFLKEVKARTKQQAFEKYYRYNRKKHLNWRRTDLIVRSYNRRSKRAKTK